MQEPQPEPEPEFDALGFRFDADRHSELDPPGGWMPDDELAAAGVGMEAISKPPKEKQINFRLDRERYAALEAAADLYGTTPTAFARTLVNRGVQATLASHRAEFRANPQD